MSPLREQSGIERQIFLDIQWLTKERNFALWHHSGRVIDHLCVWSSFINKQCLKHNLITL